MEKLYNRIDWHNNTTPAINETNLNKMSKALDDLDDRVVLIAGDILVTVPELQEMLEDCTELEQRLEAMTENPPYIGENGHWYIWDTDTGAYVDSGIDASITVEIADITMLEPNATPYVTNTGTDTDPIFHLFIPRGQSGKGISSIAKTGTSGYVDTYTITYTDNTSTTYTVTNGRNTDQVTAIPTASAALVGTIYQYIGASTSSFTHGFYYECVNDGGVYKWVNIPVGNDPVALTSTDPYTSRQGKGNLADMEIVGASVGWNQYIPDKSTTTNSDITFTVDNTAHTITISGTASANADLVFYPDSVVNGFKGVTEHKYLYKVDNRGLTQDTITYRFISNDGFSNVSNLTSERSYRFMTCTDGTKGAGIMLRVTSGTDCTTPVVVNYPNLIDLTLLFGSTIADAIYAMETAQVGSGVAFFRNYFPKEYYAYDAGSIQSVCVGSRKVAPKNYFNREDVINAYLQLENGKITASASNSYSIFCYLPKRGIYTVQKTASSTFRYALYDNKPIPGKNCINGSYVVLPSNYTKSEMMVDHECWFAMFCVNSSSSEDVARMEEILDSVKVVSGLSTAENEYSFDSTKQLRGMFDLVNGELKANGDIYTADGNIQRKYGIVTFDGSSDENWADYSSGNGFRLSISDMKSGEAQYGISNYLCMVTNLNSLGIEFGRNDTRIYIAQGLTISGVTDLATWKTYLASHPLTVVYPIATSTTESAQPYQNPQRAYIDGTEEFTDGLTRDVMIPVGNNTTYQQDKILPSVEDYVDAVAEPKADISAIGTNETGATASKAYTTGQHFYKDGKFCTAIANIASNAAFTLNTNYVEGTIAEALEAINVSGGHTIVDSSGSSMTARSKLQFDGATVTDDPANDKTIVTGTPQSMIGDAWVTSHAYAVGDYCIDGNVLYKCKTAHTSSASNRPPYASYWDAVSVSSQLKEVYEEGEVKIGTYLGKDLYRQVVKLNITLSQNSQYKYDYPYTTINGYVANIYALFDNEYFVCNSSNTNYTHCYYSRADNSVRIFQNITSSILIKALVVEYTKEKWS